MNVRLRKTIKKDGYSIESLYYQDGLKDQIPAMLLMPDGVSSDHPAAAVICLHQFAYGKNEPAGLDGAAMHHTVVALAQEGYVVLCSDILCLGERRENNLKNHAYERFELRREWEVPGREEHS